MEILPNECSHETIPDVHEAAPFEDQDTANLDQQSTIEADPANISLRSSAFGPNIYGDFEP